MELKFIQGLHISSKRKYLKRMNNNKVNCMAEAQKFGKTIGMEIESLVMVDISILKIDGSQLLKNY